MMIGGNLTSHPLFLLIPLYQVDRVNSKGLKQILSCRLARRRRRRARTISKNHHGKITIPRFCFPNNKQRIISTKKMMKQVATLFALVSSAAAFAPAKQQASSGAAALQAKPFADALGAQAPVSTTVLKPINKPKGYLFRIAFPY
jgi:hypothetical protein